MTVKFYSTLALELATDPLGRGYTGMAAELIRMLRSRDFLVQEFAEPCGAIRLSICRTAWDVAGRSWRAEITWGELQRLKREAGYGDEAAYEVYPADADVVNVANMRHLFIPRETYSWVWRSGRARAGES